MVTLLVSPSRAKQLSAHPETLSDVEVWACFFIESITCIGRLIERTLEEEAPIFIETAPTWEMASDRYRRLLECSPSDLSSPASADSIGDLNAPDSGVSSGSAREIPSAVPSSPPGGPGSAATTPSSDSACRTDPLSRSLTFSPRGSLARLRAWLENVAADLMGGGYGLKSLGPYERFVRPASSQRTLPGFSPSKEDSPSPRCSGTWPRAGIVSGGSIFALPTLERPTRGSGSSFSRGEHPTPSATEYGSSQNEGQVPHDRPTRGTPSLSTWARAAWATPTARDAKGGCPNKSHGGRDLALEAENWPTPMAADHDRGTGTYPRGNATLTGAASQWPTPTAGDAKASGSRNTPSSAAHQGTSLTDAVRSDGGRGRRDQATPTDGSDGSPPEGRRPPSNMLNPDFVESLMGLPVGWTCLPESSANAAATLEPSNDSDARDYGLSATPSSPTAPGWSPISCGPCSGED